MEKGIVFLIQYFGVKVKAGNGNGKITTTLTPLARFTKTFSDRDKARKYAGDNVNTFTNPMGDYIRYYDVVPYTPLASEYLESSQSREVVQNELTENLDPVVLEYLSYFFSSDRLPNFVYVSLKISPNDFSKQAIALQARFIADIMMRERAESFKQFFKKIEEAYLRSQAESRIVRFIAAKCGVEEVFATPSDVTVDLDTCTHVKP